MAYRGALVLQKAQKNSQKIAKQYPKCMKKGEFSSEGRRRLMDDEQPGIDWEKYLKDQK